jgi:hypothetical protein
MTKPRKPALPAAVAARMEKMIVMTVEWGPGESAHDRFIKAVRDGVTPDLYDLQVVAAQLELVLSKKETFGRAFGLIAGQGRKSDSRTSSRNQVMRGEVRELRKEGWSLERAVDLVARRYSVSTDSVLKIHKQRHLNKKAFPL